MAQNHSFEASNNSTIILWILYRNNENVLDWNPFDFFVFSVPWPAEPTGAVGGVRGGGKHMISVGK